MTRASCARAARCFRSAAAKATRATAFRSWSRSCAVCLTGLGFGVEPTGRHNDGCFMAVFKVDAFRPLAEFKKEVGEFAAYLKATRPAEGSSGVYYPGEIEHLREQDRRENGIEVEDATWYKLRTLAEGYGLAEQLGFTEVE